MQRARYWRDPDYYRQLARESYARNNPRKPRVPDERFLPECRLACDNCPYRDCILPANWLKQAYFNEFKKNNPDYFRQYREEHKEERKAYNKERYLQKRDDILAKQRLHRQKPEVKAARAAYDKQWQKSNPDAVKKKKAKYVASHREEIRARKKAYNASHQEEIRAQRRSYYAAHKDEICAKRREQYAARKKEVLHN